MAPERLKGKAKPKLMVLPYRLSDRQSFTFGDDVKAEYLAAANLIEKYSNGLSKPEYVFNPVVDIPETVADMVILRQNQQQQWQRDEAKSTWGFIRKLIANADAQIDFTGIDGVIMHGSSTSNESNIAEAMMFSKNPRDPWFRTIKTAEGELLNAVLLDKRTSIETIAHEIMHLYGLTDLYGTSTGPGNLSLMASNADGLLSYEKWVLGWIKDTQVQCLDEATEINQNQVSTRIKIPSTDAEHIVVINPGKKGTALIIEILTISKRKYLAFYSLDNEMRPPIVMNPTMGINLGYSIDVTDNSGVGLQFVSTKYNLLVTDSNADELTLDLIPKSQLSAASSLINTAEQNRIRIAQTKPITPSNPVIWEPKVKSKKTITCTKGNTVRKVTKVNPKCPAGFKKK